MPFISALVALVLFCALPASAYAKLNVLKSSLSGLLVELELPSPDSQQDAAELLKTQGLVRVDSVQLPFLSRLVAAPPGADIELYVRRADYVDISVGTMDVAPSAQRATSHPLGTLRGVAAHALHLHPYEYDASRRVLRVYTRLRVEVRFVGGRTAKRVPTAAVAPAHDAFLNGAEAASFFSPRAAGKIQAETWYDPARPWLKAHVDEYGIQQIDRAWLANFVDAETIDPRTLRLFYMGQEQALYVRGAEDGRFDEGDYLLFHAQYRRGERDFDNLYGRRNTYWLTWGGQEGLRFA